MNRSRPPKLDRPAQQRLALAQRPAPYVLAVEVEHVEQVVVDGDAGGQGPFGVADPEPLLQPGKARGAVVKGDDLAVHQQVRTTGQRLHQLGVGAVHLAAGARVQGHPTVAPLRPAAHPIQLALEDPVGIRERLVGEHRLHRRVIVHRAGTSTISHNLADRQPETIITDVRARNRHSPRTRPRAPDPGSRRPRRGAARPWRRRRRRRAGSAGGGRGGPGPEVLRGTGGAAVSRGRPPRAGRAPQLDAAWLAIVERLRARELRGRPLVFGGRSMGARVACRTAADGGAIGVLCLAFPLLPPRRAKATKPPESRLPELDSVPVPTLVIQGVRDQFGMPPEGACRQVVQVTGDHSLRTGLATIGETVGAWLDQLIAGQMVDPERMLGRSDRVGLGLSQVELGAEVDRHQRATVGGVGGLDRAPVGVGGLPDDRQPETGAGLGARIARAVEAIEHVRQVLLVKAGTVVADGQRPVVQGDLDRLAGRAPLDRVVEQVGHRASDPIALAA